LRARVATKKRTTKARESALSRAEHRIGKAVKDAVADVENRVMLAGEAADESTSSEVNILSTIEVAIHPPKPDPKAKRKKQS
jgi:hypothetical protein